MLKQSSPSFLHYANTPILRYSPTFGSVRVNSRDSRAELFFCYK
jgi:hypothetical protein